MTITGRFKPREGTNRVRILPDPTDVHLHWDWRRGPMALDRLATGVTVCKLSKIPRVHLTVMLDDVTCLHCRKRISMGESNGQGDPAT